MKNHHLTGVEYPQVISLRHSLSKDHQGLTTSLRQAFTRFLQLASSNGYARGCNYSKGGAIKNLDYVLPAWVAVDNSETRTIEGVIVRSKIATNDFPLKPWHTYYDWNFFIYPDKQYTYLLSQSNIEDHSQYYGGTRVGILEAEWDTGFLPR